MSAGGKIMGEDGMVEGRIKGEKVELVSGDGHFLRVFRTAQPASVPFRRTLFAAFVAWTMAGASFE